MVVVRCWLEMVPKAGPGAPETAVKATLKGRLVLHVDGILWAGQPMYHQEMLCGGTNLTVMM